MEQNPYAVNLGERDPHEVLATSADLVQEAVCAMSPEQIEQPIAPGKWSPREIVAHLADCELVFGFRLRQVLAGNAGGEPISLQPFDQTAWATRYAVYDLPSALALFCASRAWNVRLLGGATGDDRLRAGFHPQRGLIFFDVIVQTMAGHDLNHLAQLQKVAAEA